MHIFAHLAKETGNIITHRHKIKQLVWVYGWSINGESIDCRFIERLNSVQQKTLRERKVFHNVHC